MHSSAARDDFRDFYDSVAFQEELETNYSRRCMDFWKCARMQLGAISVASRKGRPDFEISFIREFAHIPLVAPMNESGYFRRSAHVNGAYRLSDFHCSHVGTFRSSLRMKKDMSSKWNDVALAHSSCKRMQETETIRNYIKFLIESRREEQGAVCIII